MVSPAQGMTRLLEASRSGGLDELCRRHGIRVLTVFGSAARREPNPRDLDVGVLFEPDAEPDVLGLLADLEDLTGTNVDLGVVDGASAVFRDRALGHGEPVWESTPGAWINAAVAASIERMDTAWLRRLDLERRAAG